MAIWRWVLVIAVALVPAAAYGQADDNPEADALTVSEAPGAALECRGTGLKIGAAEVSGARFVCQVSGAPSSDSSFSVQALGIADQTNTAVPICTGPLAGGAGTCTGAFIDRAASGLPQVTVAGTLQPSGAALGPVVIGPPAPAPGTGSEPMQFYPLPGDP
jgi:hypothetical protein